MKILPFLAAALLAILPVCAVAQAGGHLSVSFINPGGASGFWGDVSNTMAAAAEDLGIDLEVIHTDRDRLAMVAAAQQIAAREQHPDFVIIVNELQQAPVLIDALADTDVRMFELLNRMSDDQRSNLSQTDMARLVGSIEPDNEVAGYEMATSIISAARSLGLDEDGLTMLALLGDAATPAALAREEGLKRALRENPDVGLVRSIPVLWNETTAYERTQVVLRRFTIDTIWSANDQISFGAQRAVAEAGGAVGETTVFAGLNWSHDGLQAVRDGKMTMTHGGHFFAGAWSMVMLRDIADGNLGAPALQSFPMSAVTSAEVDFFLDHFGNRDWRIIDFTSFLRRPGQSSDYDFSSRAILAATAVERLDN